MTKADKIRTLDDDGLAEWLTKLWCDAIVEGFRANGFFVPHPEKSETRLIKLRMLELLKESEDKNE